MRAAQQQQQQFRQHDGALAHHQHGFEVPGSSAE